MPFAGYKNFEACVQANKDKENPEAYCAVIKRKTEHLHKESSLGDELAYLDGSLWRKFGFTHKGDVDANWEEYKQAIRQKVGSRKIPSDVGKELEEDNFHSLIRALIELGNLSKRYHLESLHGRMLSKAIKTDSIFLHSKSQKLFERVCKESFTEDDMKQLLSLIQRDVKQPYVKGYVSTLGGHPSVLLTVSKDKESDWANGYVQNSAHGKFSFHDDGSMEMISGSLNPWMRKGRFKTPEQAVMKLNKYLMSAKGRYNESKLESLKRRVCKEADNGWEYFDLLSTHNEQKWIKGNGDKIIVLKPSRDNKLWKVITQTVTGNGDNKSRFFNDHKAALDFIRKYTQQY